MKIYMDLEMDRYQINIIMYIHLSYLPWFADNLVIHGWVSNYPLEALLGKMA